MCFTSLSNLLHWVQVKCRFHFGFVPCLFVSLSVSPCSSLHEYDTRLDLDEACSLKDVEICDLSREIEVLRSVARTTAKTGERSAQIVAMEAALAKAETEVMAAVGFESPGRREGDSKVVEVVQENEVIEERRYDKEERSFVEMSDSEDDEEGEELDYDDDDEEWLPGEICILCVFSDWCSGLC